MSSISTSRHLLTSLTRIADFGTVPFKVASVPREAWDTGDYVLGEVIGSVSPSSQLELTNGRMMTPMVGDSVVGALGIRAATLEAVGHWQDVGEDGILDCMTSAGLLGRITSRSHYVGSVVRLKYRGHVVRSDNKVTMSQFAPSVDSPVEFNCPCVLIIGTSMSSGKTTSGRVLVRKLVESGLRVVGAKLTGAGRYRDVQAYYDSGASAIFDFVDCGLPSTVCSEDVYRNALEKLLGQIAAATPDVVVVEAGASPLEPYNGDTAVQRIQPHVRCTILCASDPYAVVGVTQGFGFQPDLVTGVATSTSAGCQVVEGLTGLRALNLMDPSSHDELVQLLKTKLGI
ncbi:MAG: DUF1611 domain-containing protein [Planctomycetaceae bacterium]|nr:DUF1611 domain-containing protein [Planctomycetaceae bacterium]MCA9043886.1 DUF1611 domain-containing protein [Planctomycetaceae bacterium]